MLSASEHAMMVDQATFLLLVRNKVDLLMGRISLNEPLIEISTMLTSRLEELQRLEEQT